MTITKTQTLHLENTAASIALSPDENSLAVVGSHLFKIYSVKDNGELEERINLRSSKNQNLNYSSSDVEFCPIDDRILASASTNGSVIIWNIGKSGRAKLTNVYKDHDRTVNSVNFHPSDQHLVLSGSQDGQMKLFDYRVSSKSVQTFSSNSESVRDVRFNPHTPHYFAAGTDSCNVQLWDTRRPDRYERLIKAHHGPVFALDWHPRDRNCIATASRDCSIKVWDVADQVPTVTSAITTVASVARVKWRPTHYYHLASCSLTLDSSACIWDVQRPYVPIASFTCHRESTSALQWRSKSNSFLTVSKDGRLFHHCLDEAYRPRLRGCPFPLAVSPLGTVAFCAPTRARNKERALADSLERAPSDPASERQEARGGLVSHRRQTSLTNPANCPVGSAPTSPATPLVRYPPPLPNGDLQVANFPPPRLGMRELASFDDIGPILSEFSVVGSNDDALCVNALRNNAQHYRLQGATDEQLAESCEHNSAVAARNGRPQEAQMWELLKVTFLGDFTLQSSSSPTGPSAQAAGTTNTTTAGGGGAAASGATPAAGQDKAACTPAKDRCRDDSGPCSDQTALRSPPSTREGDDPLVDEDRTLLHEDEPDSDPDTDDEADTLDDGSLMGFGHHSSAGYSRMPSRFSNGLNVPGEGIFFEEGEMTSYQPTSHRLTTPRAGSGRRALGANSFLNLHSEHRRRLMLKGRRPLSSNEELLEIKDEAFEPGALHSFLPQWGGEAGLSHHDTSLNGGLEDGLLDACRGEDMPLDHPFHDVSLEGMDSGGEGDSGELESSDGKGGGGNVLAVTMPLRVSLSALPPLPSFDYTDSVIEALKFTAFRGDISTCVSAIIILGDRIEGRLSKHLVEHWFTTYIDQLQRLRLFNRATVIMQSAVQIPKVHELNNRSTVISQVCPQCNALLPPRSLRCRKCSTVVNMCSWCRQVVNGLYVVCQGCGHGGHLYHIAEWFKTRNTPDNAPAAVTDPISTASSLHGGDQSPADSVNNTTKSTLGSNVTSVSSKGGSKNTSSGSHAALPSNGGVGNLFFSSGATSSVFAAHDDSAANFTQMANLVCPAGCGHLCEYM